MGNAKRTVLIASDHAGFALKERLKKNRPDIDWIDKGPMDSASVDYPDYADRVSRAVVRDGHVGVLICGSGQGMAMRANKYREIRAALVWNDEVTKLSRTHNNANVLVLAARISNHDDCERWLDIFLKTSFEGGRHTGRVDKIGLPADC